MFNLDFAFAACHCRDLPREIRRERLFNVSFDPVTGDVKLYVLDESDRFLYKISRERVSTQYAGDDPDHGGDPRRLVHHLGRPFNFRQIVIDAVEDDDTYYLYLDDAGDIECLRLVDSICNRYDVEASQFLATVNSINKRQFRSLEEAVSHKSFALVKIPLYGSGVKIYSRPFYSGNDFDLDKQTREFLIQLHDCDENSLKQHLKRLWVARELQSDRLLIVTQNHALLHRE